MSVGRIWIWSEAPGVYPVLWKVVALPVALAEPWNFTEMAGSEIFLSLSMPQISRV